MSANTDSDPDAAGLTQGLLHLPGSDHATRALVQKLMLEDVNSHHCYWEKIGFHNHLPHHILALYDLGAPADVIQKMYNAEAKGLNPINLVDRKDNFKTGDAGVTITKENWTEHLGPEQNYAPYLAFFKAEVERLGPAEAVEEYIFSSQASSEKTAMLRRVVSAGLHSIIQIGYGLEFHLNPILAAGLAETAVTLPTPAEIHAAPDIAEGGDLPLLGVLRAVYDSDVLKPAMPYDNDPHLSRLPQRVRDALSEGRAAEMQKLAASWCISASAPSSTSPSQPSSPTASSPFALNTQEALTLATLLLVGTSKPHRKPRLDFFLMHLLTSSLFLPTCARVLTPGSTARLMRAWLSAVLLNVVMRGRPRVDCALVMGYEAQPGPPTPERKEVLNGVNGANGHGHGHAAHVNGTKPKETTRTQNSWPTILAEVIHAPDSHTVKTIRTLYHAAQQYGECAPGTLPGALSVLPNREPEETLRGSSELDGTLFVRAAGVVMSTLGWVTHGQKEGQWDRSGLGWEAAWEGGEPGEVTLSDI